MAVRKRNGITPASELTILKYDGDAYVSQIDDKVIMKIGSRQGFKSPDKTFNGRAVVTAFSELYPEFNGL